MPISNFVIENRQNINLLKTFNLSKDVIILLKLEHILKEMLNGFFLYLIFLLTYINKKNLYVTLNIATNDGYNYL